MSWFKRKNDALNGEGSPERGASPPSHHIEMEWDEVVAELAAQEAQPAPLRLTDSERLGYDAVNMPDHYRRFKIEPMRYCVENALNIFQFSINKYVTRYPHKNGVEDLKKAARILDMAIAFEEGDRDWWRLPGERASKRFYLID